MLSNLLSNKTLCHNKDLFLAAMQEATDSIIGQSEGLPPNRFGRQGGGGGGIDFAVPPKIDTTLRNISTHHSPPRARPSSTTSSASSSSQPPIPPPLKIPLHHLSPLNKTASGPKAKEELVSEFAKLRSEKIKAIHAAKERDVAWKTPILTVYEEEEDIMSPAPTYESTLSSTSIESLLTSPQLSTLKSIFTTLSPRGESVASRTLLSTVHRSRSLRGVFGEVVIDEVRSRIYCYFFIETREGVFLTRC